MKIPQFTGDKTSNLNVSCMESCFSNPGLAVARRMSIPKKALPLYEIPGVRDPRNIKKLKKGCSVRKKPGRVSNGTGIAKKVGDFSLVNEDG